MILPLITFLLLGTLSAAENHPVTCGSAVTLQSQESKYFLHSHGIAWGSGSGQQSVTAHPEVGGAGNLWLIKTGFHSPTCVAGEAIKCGERVRIELVQTGKLLHSHLFKAPLSGNQEVSCFGDGGEGDTGDDWVLDCEAGQTHWIRGSVVTLKHADTGKYLSTSKSYSFTQQNCGGGCPIMGQTEIAADHRNDVKAKWLTSQGVYFLSKDSTFAESDEEDDEL
jgi:dolichyl-phosphate-mannose--protein O-mannosyl transferase